MYVGLRGAQDPVEQRGDAMILSLVLSLTAEELYLWWTTKSASSQKAKKTK
jgi:hypothetical protein